MRKILSISFAIGIVFNAYSQDFASIINLKSSNQQLIEDAVKPSFYISKRSFQLKDSLGNFFGRGGKNEFDVEYSLALKVEDGFLLDARGTFPWNFSEIFEKYKSRYTPVIYESYWSELGDSTSFKELSLNNATSEVLVDSVLYFYKSDCFQNKGLSIDRSQGKKEGWLVWIVGKDGSSLSSNHDLDVITYRYAYELSLEEDSLSVKAPNDNRYLIGGIYVVPDFSEIGAIKFRLCGVLEKCKDKWALFFPFMDNGLSTVSPKDKDKEDETESDLTPVSSKKSKKDKKKKK